MRRDTGTTVRLRPLGALPGGLVSGRCRRRRRSPHSNNIGGASGRPTSAPGLPDRATEVLAAYRSALAPGSVVVFSHTSDDHDDPELAARVRAANEIYRNSATPGTLRSSRAELHASKASTPTASPPSPRPSADY